MSDEYKLIYPIKFFKDNLDNNSRNDGRDFDSYRPVGINTGSFANAHGSSCVKLGNSNIACGIRAELCKPSPASPSDGYIVPNIDFSFVPTAARQKLKMSPDMINCLIYNALSDQKVIKLEDLCVQKKKLVWVLYIDIVCLEIDGGVLSASMTACIAALKTLELPKIVYDQDTDNIHICNEKYKIKLNMSPTLSSYCIFDEKVLVDPTAEEENIANAQVTIGVTNNSVGLFIKSGGQPVNVDQLSVCLADAVRRDIEITKLINITSNI